jgi:hypothetical protein
VTDLLPTIVGIALLALAAGFVLLPLARGVGTADDAAAPSDVPDARFRLYRQIIELEFDQQLGKLSKEDFQQQSAELLGQAGAMLESERGTLAELDDEIEREIAAARAAFTAVKRTSKRPASARR